MLIERRIFFSQILKPTFFFIFSLPLFVRLLHMARNRDQLRSLCLMGIYFKATWKVMRVGKSLNNQAGRSDEELEHHSSLLQEDSSSWLSLALGIQLQVQRSFILVLQFFPFPLLPVYYLING